MADRKKWREVLEGEVALWSGKTPQQVIADLPSTKAYQVRVGSVEYQVEVELLENTDSHIHIALGVDDGTLPSSIFPVSASFILKKCDRP
jgi:hypothetical protein